eukprot:scaffold133129_cov18-Tisochrysis_lutea.AAC.1
MEADKCKSGKAQVAQLMFSSGANATPGLLLNNYCTRYAVKVRNKGEAYIPTEHVHNVAACSWPAQINFVFMACSDQCVHYVAVSSWPALINMCTKPCYIEANDSMDTHGMRDLFQLRIQKCTKNSKLHAWAMFSEAGQGGAGPAAFGCTVCIERGRSQGSTSQGSTEVVFGPATGWGQRKQVAKAAAAAQLLELMLQGVNSLQLPAPPSSHLG